MNQHFFQRRHFAAELRKQQRRTDRQLPPPGAGRNWQRIVWHKLNRALLDSARIDSNPGQNEPRVLCKMDVSNFRGIEIVTEAANNQFKCANDGLLRRFTNAASQRFVGYSDEVPSAASNSLFQPSRASRPDDAPAVRELVSFDDEAWG
ncbi:MAG: hypothetical protein ABSB50_10160 [Terracidiphilus sp.]